MSSFDSCCKSKCRSGAVVAAAGEKGFRERGIP